MILACFTSHTAAAQTIESLVMPGEVIHGHMDVESECSSCHKRFDRSAQDGLCLDCHEDIASDTEAGAGFHGKSDDVGDNACNTCHTDHIGRNADILGLDEETFDHAIADFELLGKHLEAECAGCHEPEAKHRDAPGECIDCHREDEPHEGKLGTECADCHNPSDWTDSTFDHDTTDFPLVGKHREAECTGCHEDQTHQDTPTTCFACHAEDDSHEGRSGEQCNTCHNPTSWTDTSFDHAKNTDFPLDGKHAQLSCNDCHSEDPFDDVDEMDMECIACHLEDDDHEGHRGTDCANCHSNEAWTENIFDHDMSTDFVLNGTHETTACVDCHVEPISETSPDTRCSSCHLDDEPHDGTLGEECSDCHNETVWKDAPLFDHDLSSFPLLGAHDDNECDACHETQLFGDTAGECVGCHLEDDSHKGAFEDKCASCHNPVAWDLWLFDHNMQTDFELDGAHIDVACNDCHRSSLASMRKTGERCMDCHRSDDIHDAEFGSDCGRCHSDSSFNEVRSLQ
ncbi:MAG: cytochrome C [Gammaproteobacteria bacterium]|nr:cytochrome C [Gammaproteobacteria bacterium]